MKKLIFWTLLISSLWIAAGSGAQQVAQPDTLKGDIAAFKGDQNTLVGIIARLEQATGGRVVDVRFSNLHGTPGYHAVVVTNRQVKFFHIEDKSANFAEIDEHGGPIWMLGARSRADVYLAKHAPISLTAAIRTAEQSVEGAPALAAGIARSASNPSSDVHAYTVLLSAHGRIRSVSIDDSSGEVIANPASLDY